MGAGGCDDAVDGVVDDVGDCVFGIKVTWAGKASLPGEVEGGDLEAVEEESGAAGVEGVGGDTAENFSDGELDGGPVFEVGKIELGLERAAFAKVLDGWA